MHDVAQLVQLISPVCHIKQRCVVLVDEHHDFPACLRMGTLYQTEKTKVEVRLVRQTLSIDQFILRELAAQFLLQFFSTAVFCSTHIETQYRICRPLLLHTVDIQPLEQLAPALEIALDG